jgi:hypothetical protein
MSRYDCYHVYGNVTFYLANHLPDLDEVHLLLMKVLEQAVRDYCSLHTSDLHSDQLIWEESRDFIFDDSYRFMWGDRELSFSDLLDILNLDVSWFRVQTKKKFEEGV